ncbi:MAG: hypothetical protein PHZ13_10055, partial [bacterium]|nr:hypothetical protein [bacterium]
MKKQVNYRSLQYSQWLLLAGILGPNAIIKECRMAALGWLPGIRINQAESWEDVGIIKEAVNLAEEKATAKTSVLLEETRIFEAPKDL